MRALKHGPNWVLFALFCLTFFQCSSASAQEPCPEGYKCIPDEVAEKYVEALEEYQCLQGEAPYLIYDPYKVVVTKEGQVFAQGDLTGTLDWCSYKMELSASPRLVVSQVDKIEEPTYGFRLRLKLGVSFSPQYYTGEGVQDMFDPVVLVEPMYWRILHPQAHVGLQSTGVSLGVDLTKNLDFYSGVGVQWGTWDPVFIAGVSLSLN